MSVTSTPADPTLVDKSGQVVPTWRAFFNSVAYWLRPVGASGPTANRPVDTSSIQLYIGQPYFDTSLGKPIWVQSRNPTVWCDATGASV